MPKCEYAPERKSLVEGAWRYDTVLMRISSTATKTSMASPPRSLPVRSPKLSSLQKARNGRHGLCGCLSLVQVSPVCCLVSVLQSRHEWGWFWSKERYWDMRGIVSSEAQNRIEDLSLHSLLPMGQSPECRSAGSTDCLPSIPQVMTRV